MLNVGGLPAGSSKITREQIIEALGYEPAKTEEIAGMAGVNLILDSATEVNNSDYLVYTYTMAEPAKLNQTYTITIWGELVDGKTFSVFFGSAGENFISSHGKNEDGIYSRTFEKNQWEKPNDDFTKLQIYASPKNLSVTSIIHKVKLEKGAVTNPIWSPAPEDIITHTEFDELVKRVEALEDKLVV